MESIPLINLTTIKEDKQKFGAFVFKLVKDYYDNTLLKQNKPQINEWTNHSLIILEHNNLFKPIIYSNGNKSLPNKHYLSRKFQVFDSHTEILSLKCFKLFILKCVAYSLIKSLNINDWHINIELNKVLSKNEYEQFDNHNDDYFNIFKIEDTVDKKIELKDNVRFHLYISDCPCGIENNSKSASIEHCCSILSENSITVSKMNATNEGIDLKAKCSIKDTTKKDNISLSLSCFDKLILRSILGIQGKYLNSIMKKIFLSSMIISKKTQEDTLEQTLMSNFVSKGKQLINEFNYTFTIPHFIVINEQLSDYSGNYNQRNIMPFSSYWSFPSIQGKLDPVTGLKCGSNLNNINQLDKYRSMLSQYDLCSFSFSLIKAFPQLPIIGHLNKKMSLCYYHNRTDDLIQLMSSIISNKDKQINKLLITHGKYYTPFIQLKQSYINE